LSLPFSPMPFPLFLEQLVGVLADVAVRLDRRDRDHDDHVAACGFERTNQGLDGSDVRSVDDPCEIVDGPRELGQAGGREDWRPAAATSG